MSLGRMLRDRRIEAGLTQAQLALRARVSRALVSAVEAGRHLPRIDAALALARVLGVPAEVLFAPVEAPVVDALSGEPPAKGAPLRLGRVGSRLVSAPSRREADGWDLVDGEGGDADLATRRAAGVVMAGCEPGLVLLERLLGEQGVRALAIPCSSAAALSALAAGRLHAAAVHFPGTTAPPDPARIARIHLARWRVGLAAPRGSARGWWDDALRGRGPVVQREPEAAAQQTFLRALRGRAPREVAGPRVATHLAASRHAVVSRLPAVTIEPAAAAVGAAFHPLESHVVELWLDADRLAERGVERLVALLAELPFRRALAAVGGYDLSGLGTRVA